VKERDLNEAEEKTAPVVAAPAPVPAHTPSGKLEINLDSALEIGDNLFYVQSDGMGFLVFDIDSFQAMKPDGKLIPVSNSHGFVGVGKYKLNVFVGKPLRK
jgi:hypothetical protein